ncbi:MAG: terpene cyclase/mutase family protein, partial [Acidobacteriota bacterium]|nr:terpene cyclase/mutase family protein [Acidobacteriota bacterium]
HVATELFDELAAGTYGPDDFDTAGWIANIQTGRSGEWINLRPWEFHALINVAGVLGQPGQDALFEQGVLDGLNTLDNSQPSTVYSDIIGLAGAVRGLAYARRYTFPAIVAPLHTGVNGIDNLEDLAAYLASLQNPNGSWYWHSNLAAPVTGDEDVQTTAYALLALLEVDVMTAASYQPATEAARDWLVSMQLPNGGFPEYPGGDENTEVEGEAVTAMADFDAVLFVDGFEAGNTDLWTSVVP